ncbi:MAG: hypothetical protein M3296_03760 [Actinomycetota bacterium]|nr:hypothetical protein [Actinomycetota bacterium]
MTVSDALRGAGIATPVSDGDFLLTCVCGRAQRLDAMTITECGDLTLYDCPVCDSSVVGVVSGPAAELWGPGPLTRLQEQAGHRLHGCIVGSKVDVVLRPPEADRDLVLIPATPNFFIQARYL